MQKVISKYPSFKEAEQAEKDYYKSLTPQERMDVFLQILETYNEANYPDSKGLERVARVIKRVINSSDKMFLHFKF